MRIVITGSEGLVGTALRAALEGLGHTVQGLDIAATGADQGDTRRLEDLERSVQHADGIVHLAAVSRVLWGERDPEACWHTNVGGTKNVLDACAATPGQPWVVFASSREVYGQAAALPVREDTPLSPVNIYGRSKVAGEELTLGARAQGLRTAVVRLSNVYGSVADHADRVVPAFTRAAVEGGVLRIDGPDHTFDFTHLDDTVRGIIALLPVVAAGTQPSPLHLLTGRATTLGELAEAAIRIAGTSASTRLAPPRSYDVATFFGDPSHTSRVLGGWRAKVSVREGVARLVEQMRAEVVA